MIQVVRRHVIDVVQPANLLGVELGLFGTVGETSQALSSALQSYGVNSAIYYQKGSSRLVLSVQSTIESDKPALLARQCPKASQMPTHPERKSSTE